MFNTKILYLEDEPEIREHLSSLLQLKFPNLISFENGQEGLEYIINGNIPDLIITDINMPKMDGKVFLKHIFKLGYNIPAIITSGHMIEEEVKEDDALKICVKELFKKPIDVRQLLNSIEKNL